MLKNQERDLYVFLFMAVRVPGASHLKIWAEINWNLILLWYTMTREEADTPGILRKGIIH